MDITKLNGAEWEILMKREAEGLTKITKAYENGLFVSGNPDSLPDLTKENCTHELWAALGGDVIDNIDDDKLPF